MGSKKQVIIFSDLDGSLLNHSDFKFNKVNIFINKCLDLGIKIIINSSKTKNEIKNVCKDLMINVPFISENGSEINNLDLIVTHQTPSIVLSRPKEQIYNIFKTHIKHTLRKHCVFIKDLEYKKRVNILGFTDKNVEIALDRKFTHPFIFDGSENEKIELLRATKKLGLNMIQGGRLYNLCDDTNKGKAMNFVLNILSEETDNFVTIGVGDSYNDLEMLNNSDYPCIVRNDFSNFKYNAQANYIISNNEAPSGWMEVVTLALKQNNIYI